MENGTIDAYETPNLKLHIIKRNQNKTRNKLKSNYSSSPLLASFTQSSPHTIPFPLPQNPNPLSSPIMDPRRPGRTVPDPMVRQVGFFTPPPVPMPVQPAHIEPSSPPPPHPTTTTDTVSPNSLSPVMIPPPRHVAALSPLRRGRETEVDVVVGSYGTSDAVLGVFDDESDVFSLGVGVGRSGSGRFGTSLPSGGGYGLRDGKGIAGAADLGPVANAGNTAVANENAIGSSAEIRSDKLANSKSAKEKTSKAERRALQESQRAAKAAARAESGKAPIAASAEVGTAANAKQPKTAKTLNKDTASVVASEKKGSDHQSEKDRKKDVPHPRMQFDDISRVEKAKKRAVVKRTEARNRVELFRHLPQYEHGTQLPDLESKFFQLDQMHPAVYKLENEAQDFKFLKDDYNLEGYLSIISVGLQYLTGDISGGNARCIAMLEAFQEAVKDYSTPPEKTLIRDLTAKVSSYVSFLIECRPLSISMGNAIRFLKTRIANLPLTLSESEAKASLQSDIDNFIGEKILLGDKVIVKHAVTKIRDGDILLTYGSSSSVEMIFLHAHELGKQFRVVVVDSRPKFEGQLLLRRLVAKGISCTYTHINAVSYVMHEVTRVFLGAASVLSNGTVYSRVGTASVAMVANAFRVPVLVCCEAYKFHERVQLDSICFNELGGFCDPDQIAKVPGRTEIDYLNNWPISENLQLLNLIYDATPSDYISMIITDFGMVPPTSVPVIVREYRRDQIWV
ncbi:Translation initiation factor eIF2B subunit delta-like protein [Drosera capensis]